MESFDVLSRHLNCFQSHFLEASAGTGKTFSIENIVARLLIEEKPFSLFQILVITFTKAATKDLRARIAKHLNTILDALQANPECSNVNIPDYVLAIIENGDAELAISRLQRAIATFEEAQIFTIHAFCAKMLNEHAILADIPFAGKGMETALETHDFVEKDERLVKDYLLHHMQASSYSASQLKRLIGRYTLDGAIKKISSLMQKSESIEAYPSFSESFDTFSKAIKEINEQFRLAPDNIIETFKSLAPSYVDICNRQGEIKPEILEGIERFSRIICKQEPSFEDFDALLEDGLLIGESLHESKLKKKLVQNCNRPVLHPQFEMILAKLAPIIGIARNEKVILARLVKDCLLLRNGQVEESWSPEDILRVMKKSVEKRAFVNAIQETYKVAIIDEFQDTDPLQWDIFEKCFLQKDLDAQMICYLVGDPKQSIYAFRRADIYTYLQAAKAIGSEKRAFLDTNFRSSRGLIDALNALFCKKPWMPLPKLHTHLNIERVKSPRDKELGVKNPVRFFIAKGSQGRGGAWPTPALEEDFFFPYIAREISSLCQMDGYSLDNVALLVRDRYQGERLQTFLKKQGIAAYFKRASSLVKTAAWMALQDLLKYFGNSKARGALPYLLMSPLFGWSAKEASQLDLNAEKFVLRELIKLKQILEESSFSEFYYELLFYTPLTPDLKPSLAKSLLSREDGHLFYRELQQIFELILECDEVFGSSRAENIIRTLNAFELKENDEALKVVSESENAVQILTLHGSKGLEFQIVFALGLINRTPQEDLLILKEGALTVCDKESLSYEEFLREVDAEKARQLYVAMTRAKDVLYVPLLIEEPEKASSKNTPKEDNKSALLGSISPMELFLDAHIGEITENSVRAFLEELSLEAGISFEIIQKQDTQLLSKPFLNNEVPSMYAPTQLSLMHDKLKIYSFSSLLQSVKKPYILEKNEEKRVLGIVPGGMSTGTILHNILENIMSTGSMQNLYSGGTCIYTHLKGTDLEGYDALVTEMVNHTLNVRLPSGFALNDVQPCKRLCEMEFLIPWDQKIEMEEIFFESGFLTGFIDLVVEHEDKYYIIDWKTNLLNRYDKIEMEVAMKQHGYFLQASIYTMALKKYLKSVDKRPFEECFGGVYYLFLRGINSLSLTQDGIFFIE